MFSHLIEGLRQAGLPTSITEYLTLLGAMRAGVAEWSVDDFYYLSRATLVKDERHLDRFDRVFAQCFKGLEPVEGVLSRDLPEEWPKRFVDWQATIGNQRCLINLFEDLLHVRRFDFRFERGSGGKIMFQCLVQQVHHRLPEIGRNRRLRLETGPKGYESFVELEVQRAIQRTRQELIQSVGCVQITLHTLTENAALVLQE